MRLPAVMRGHPGFAWYWSGVVASQIGVRATLAANLFHVYQLSGSTAQVGLVGLAQAVALLLLSPIGGALADRVDRRRLIQVTQLLSMVISLALAALTLAGLAEVWHVLVAVALNTAAATFDAPARSALIPALVPRDELPAAFALVTPAKELAILVGPALAGLLIAVGGPGLVYLLDAMTYLVLIVVIGRLRIAPMELDLPGASLWHSVVEGAAELRRRPIILQLMTLDVSATLFGAYQVILPALAVDILGVGPAGYGLLSSAPAAGALLATAGILRLLRTRPAGRLVLVATVAYGLSCLALAQSSWFVLALLAATAIGATDALGASIRAAAVQIETPDRLRGRVTSLYQLAARGGPAVGQATVGAAAGVVGPVLALSAGSVVPIALAVGFWLRGGRLATYRLPSAPASEAGPNPRSGASDRAGRTGHGCRSGHDAGGDA